MTHDPQYLAGWNACREAAANACFSEKAFCKSIMPEKDWMLCYAAITGCINNIRALQPKDKNDVG